MRLLRRLTHPEHQPLTDEAIDLAARLDAYAQHSSAVRIDATSEATPGGLLFEARRRAALAITARATETRW
jgi:hypothetical protein